MHRVVKTMALLVEQQPYLLVMRGHQRVDLHKARSQPMVLSSSSSSVAARQCTVCMPRASSSTRASSPCVALLALRHAMRPCVFLV